ncbi:hypothetical protein CTEN210_12732 [Chaetoceros tenuissimus]|uniref:Uncharacterized protein n=1 Tax=Chaetoceros tenuissimus TaxID=426638 RepID=A0AAD3D3U7_9STRA|nr:hypothetical protein CTEN210_12732 [Chaetoceros tenuissimus]
MYQRIFGEARRRFASRSAFIGSAAAGCGFLLHSSQTAGVTKLEYWEHDPADFDYYVSKPTIEDLPVLLHKFDVLNMEVWPWIWVHLNHDGPHHVFVGISEDSLDEIQRLRNESERNNILIIAPEEKLKEVAMKRNDPEIYERCQCGLVMDSKLELLNHEAKILMLDDERVIAFDRLILV